MGIAGLGSSFERSAAERIATTLHGDDQTQSTGKETSGGDLQTGGGVGTTGSSAGSRGDNRGRSGTGTAVQGEQEIRQWIDPYDRSSTYLLATLLAAAAAELATEAADEAAPSTAPEAEDLDVGQRSASAKSHRIPLRGVQLT